ncbi:MAG: GNAT family N-acetyltransferase [Thermincolia bacterium]
MVQSSSGTKSKKITTAMGDVFLEGPISEAKLNQLAMDDGIKMFRPAAEQHKALIRIAGMEEGLIFIARHEETIVGYVTFHRPDGESRWALELPRIILELGAIEVSSNWRRLSLGYALVETAFEDDSLEDYIVISTHYAWHWDLNGTGLTVWDYQKMLSKVMNKVGLQRRSTDDPEITAHPANMLKARIGQRVSKDMYTRFELIRHRNMFG